MAFIRSCKFQEILPSEGVQSILLISLINLSVQAEDLSKCDSILSAAKAEAEALRIDLANVAVEAIVLVDARPSNARLNEAKVRGLFTSYGLTARSVIFDSRSRQFIVTMAGDLEATIRLTDEKVIKYIEASKVLFPEHKRFR